MGMSLQQLHLTSQSIAEKPSARDHQVIDVKVTHKFNSETNQATEEIDKLSIVILGYKGSTPAIKLPVELSDKVLDLKEKLDSDSIIRVTFDKLKVRAYALINDKGQLISGVSCSAEDFEISHLDELEDLEL
jgi:hypothetical protein